MARKNLLGGLMPPSGQTPDAAPQTPAPGPAPAPAARPPASPVGGAVGAVSQTIAQLKARAVTELDPHLIDAGGLPDRLEHDEAAHARLMASIEAHGQQVPVLVRPHPETPGRYQIVYGRRRVLALRDLGQPVKAMIRALDDRDLLIAQGQENSARRDLSFIEKAHFARQMTDAGYDRRTVMAALDIDKTTLSRLLSVVGRLPPGVIETVGAAPGIGRGRWLRLAELIEQTGTTAAEACALSAGATSDARFEALLRAVDIAGRRARAAGREAVTLYGADGRALGELRRAASGTVLRLPPGAAAFGDWLAGNIADLHRTWADEAKLTAVNTKGDRQPPDDA